MKNRFVFLLALAIAFLLSSSLFSQNIIMTINGPTVVCGGNCYTYTATFSTPSGPNTHFVLYEWTMVINGNTTTFTTTVPSADICIPVSSGTIKLSLLALSDNGVQTAAAAYSIFVLPYQPVEIISSNVSPCAPDSLSQDQNALCDKVCPFSTVTYSLKDPPIAGTNSSINWTVVGAQNYTVNPPSATSVTVNWGATGAGSVSVFVIGNPNSPTGGNGCSGEASLCVTIVEEPQAKFLPDPAPAAPTDTLQVCKGQTVWFQNQSLYADTYAWYFSDDASSSTAADPQHTFLTPGLYTVRLIARSACLCADTTEALIEVLDAVAPTLDCIGDICPGATVTYKATANCSGITWAVSPNGTPLSGGAPGADSITIQWNAGPVGLITLSNFSCTGQACPQPSQIRIPIIDDQAEIRGAEKVCPDAEEMYSIYPYGGTGFVWTLSGGGQISDGQGTNSVTIKWSGFANPNTTYWLSVQYDNCYLGCGGRDSIPVRIVSPFVINGPVETCENTSKNFTSRLTSNNLSIACHWTLRAPDGSISWTSAAPTASASILFDKGSGTYRIQAVPDNPLLSCSERADWTLNVPALPGAPTQIDGPSLICPGQTFTYSAAGVSPSADIRWTVQNGPGAATILSGNPVNVSWGATGPYQLQAAQVSDDGLGCLSPPVQLNLQVLGALVINGPASRCANSTATYTAPLMPGIPYQWTLQPADAGTITQGQGTNTVEVFWQSPGNHQLNLSACNLSATRAVAVNPLASPAVNPPGPLCPGATALVQTTTPYSTYSWENAGTGNSLGSAATVDVGPGNYAVTVMDANGCSGSTNFVVEGAPAPNLTVSTPNPTGFCNNSETVVMQALTNADGNLSYEWFRDGVALGVNATSYSTNQYGQYTVQATTPAGCTALAGPITIFEDCGGGGGGAPCPLAPDCPPGNVNLQILSSLRCDSFQFQLSGPGYVAGSGQWYFGQSGGALAGTATGDAPFFVFSKPGYYIAGVIVELTSGLVCRVIDSLDVEAVAQFTAQPACPGTNSGFKDISSFLPNSGITNWNWDFGDPASGANNSSTVRNASHLYAGGGTYPVSLTVTAKSGCTAASTSTIAVPMPVTPVFALPAANCAGNALSFSSSPLSVDWNFGDPASGAVNQATGPTAYHMFPAGTYTVTATATDAFGCKSSSSQNITIVPNTLSGGITPANPSPLCQGRSLTLTAPAGATNYRWSDNSQANTLVVQTEGVYSVTLTNANGCTYAPPAVKVDVLPDPNAVVKALLTNELGQTIGVAYPTHTVCYGEDVRLFAQGTGSYSYQWSTGSVGNSIDFSSAHNGVLPVGSHLYTVTVTDLSTGCTAVTSPFLVTVNPVPSGFSIANSSAPACAAANNTLNYSGPNPGNWQYVWNNGQSGVSLQTENPGVYYLRVVNEFGCEARSNPLTILPGPNVGALPSGCHTRCKPDTLCLPVLPSVASWQWYLNGSPIPGATSPNFIAQQSGTYWAQLTDFYGCTNKSGDLSLQLLDGYGNILGQVWSDVNNNGLIDVADTLVGGISVRLLQGATPAGTAQSGPGGAFAFTNILSTNYSVEIDPALLPAGWQIIVGTDPASLAGCNAETQVGLLLKAVCLSTLTSNVQLNACPGGSALYNGTPVAVGSSQDFLFFSVAGCDSVVTVTVAPYAASTGTLNASACPGSSFDYNSTPVLAGTSQDFVLTNYLGCDSILTVTVATLPTSTGTLNASACPGSSFDYNGTPVLAGTSQDFVLTNYLGCDSILTVTVAALPSSMGTLNASACPGASFDYNGTPVLAGTSQDFVLTNYLGCDSILTVTVATLPTSTGTLNASACPGASFDYNGTPVLAGTSQDFVLTNYLGCDSILTVTVATLPTSTGTLNASACPGSSFDYNGTPVLAGTSQDFVLTNYLGCDSILTVTVAVRPVSSGGFTATVCAGSSFTYNNTVLQPGQTQDFILQNHLGCDSVVTVTVNALPALGSSLQVGACPGGTFTYQGTVLQIGQTQSFTVPSSIGCDSIVTVTVTALTSTSETLNVVICPNETFPYAGENLAPGTTQSFTFTNSQGCDSTVIVSVSALPLATFELEAASSCQYAGTGSIDVVQAAGGLPPYRYSLDGLAFQDAPAFKNLIPGPYTVWLEDSNGCLFQQDTVISAIAALGLELGDAVLPCDSAGVSLTPLVGGDLSGLGYLWSTGAQTPSITVYEPGSVWVEVHNICETLRREVVVDWEGVGKDFSFVYVPNVFAPASNDPDNSSFRPYLNPGLNVLSFRFEVYDRWGNLMFRTRQTEDGWKGPFRGQDMQPGVYVWYLLADVGFCGGLKHLEQKGDVTIVR